jgi:hypothetical protein
LPTLGILLVKLLRQALVLLQGRIILALRSIFNELNLLDVFPKSNRLLSGLKPVE